MYFQSDTSFADFIFFSALLVTERDIVQHLRNKVLVAIGLLIPLVLSPLMFDLWVRIGTGNANYLFFQGFIMWIFFGLGLIEYIKVIKKMK